jgi:hypothetical protein
MKRLASAFGGKSAQMMKPADAERMSGYKVGRISPFGQIRNIGTAIEEQAMLHDHVTSMAASADCRCDCRHATLPGFFRRSGRRSRREKDRGSRPPTAPHNT